MPLREEPAAALQSCVVHCCLCAFAPACVEGLPWLPADSQQSGLSVHLLLFAVGVRI